MTMDQYQSLSAAYGQTYMLHDVSYHSHLFHMYTRTLNVCVHFCAVLFHACTIYLGRNMIEIKIIPTWQWERSRRSISGHCWANFCRPKSVMAVHSDRDTSLKRALFPNDDRPCE